MVVVVLVSIIKMYERNLSTMGAKLSLSSWSLPIGSKGLMLVVLSVSGPTVVPVTKPASIDVILTLPGSITWRRWRTRGCCWILRFLATVVRAVKSAKDGSVAAPRLLHATTNVDRVKTNFNW